MAKKNKEETRNKALSNLASYVEKHGKEISEGVAYWGTYPVCVQDICVLGVAVKTGEDRKKKIAFGDLEHGVFKERKDASQVEALYLEEALSDMKSADSKHKSK